eukprot:jgi/Undpi1/5268/HiC_scaffold_2.g00549.m1
MGTAGAGGMGFPETNSALAEEEAESDAKDEEEEEEEGTEWGKGVSFVTVSAWQSLAALFAGFLMSRFWRRLRRTEARALSDLERTRRNRCVWVFAAAHLAGTGLEYYGCGAVGPVAVEVLRSTEAAFFCLLSLNFGMQRPGLAAMPTLLLALGLALAATPAMGELEANWGGVRASLAANFLLAVRAIAAKCILLLAVEVPRAASGLAPRLLPCLWGVGVIEGDDEGGVVGGGDWGWGAGRERARLTFLLLANGLCLYGYLVALLCLLSRLSATMFAVARVSPPSTSPVTLVCRRRYHHHHRRPPNADTHHHHYHQLPTATIDACYMQGVARRPGSATGPRSVGIALATLASAVSLYRAHARERFSSTLRGGGGGGGGVDVEAAVVSVDGKLLGQRGASALRDNLPLPHVPTFREGSPPPGAGSEGGDDSSSSPDSCREEEERRGGGGKGRHPPALFVPLLGTKHDEEAGVVAGWGAGRGNEGSDGQGGGDGTSGSVGGDPSDGADDVGRGLSPSRFAWRWMGLQPTKAETRPPSSVAVVAGPTRAAAVPAVYPRGSRPSRVSRLSAYEGDGGSSGHAIAPKDTMAGGTSTAVVDANTAIAAAGGGGEGVTIPRRGNDIVASPEAASSSRDSDLSGGGSRSRSGSELGLGRRGAGGGRAVSSASSSSFSLNGFEIIDKEDDLWN